MRRAYARWRVKVWDKRLARYRKLWDGQMVQQTQDHMHPESLEAVSTDVFWAQLVTRAMRKRTKWRKRAGVRKARPICGKANPWVPDIWCTLDANHDDPHRGGPDRFYSWPQKLSGPSDRPAP